MCGLFCNVLWLNSLHALHLELASYGGGSSDTYQPLLENYIGEALIFRSVLFLWFTRVLEVGSKEEMGMNDLVSLPDSMSAAIVRQDIQPPIDGEGKVVQEERGFGYYLFNALFSMLTSHCEFRGRWCGQTGTERASEQVTGVEGEDRSDRLFSAESTNSSTLTSSTHSQIESETNGSDSDSRRLPPLFHARAILVAILVDGQRGSAFAQLGLIKLLSLGASFAGPLLLGEMVRLVEKSPTQKDIPYGLLLACTLGASFVILAVLNTQYTMRASVMQVKIRGAFSLGKLHAQ